MSVGHWVAKVRLVHKEGYDEWQEMDLKQQAEFHEESLVPSQGSWTFN